MVDLNPSLLYSSLGEPHQILEHLHIDYAENQLPSDLGHAYYTYPQPTPTDGIVKLEPPLCSLERLNEDIKSRSGLGTRGTQRRVVQTDSRPLAIVSIGCMRVMNLKKKKNRLKGSWM